MRRSATILLLTIGMMMCGRLYAEQFAYIVRFTDKNNSAYTLSSPLSYLSARAIDRRIRQGIAIDSADLPVNKTYIDSVLSLTGGKIHGASKWLNICVVLLRDSTTIHALDTLSFVGGTQLAGYYYDSLHRPVVNNEAVETIVPAQRTTADPAFYGNTWTQTAMLNGGTLHDGGYTGNGMLIAVFDAGFADANTHVGFGSMWTSGRMVDKYNFNLANDDVFAFDTHGSRVLSAMAGYVPNTYVGSAPMASYALYVTEDGMSEQRIELVNMLFGAERADSVGADVIVSSLGYNTFDNPADNFVFATDFDGKTTIASKAANIATSKGMLFVTSAGNEGGGGWNMILTPGDADSAITVGSVWVTGGSSFSSGYGPNAAGRVKPDVCALGQGAAVFNGMGGYVNQNGTSFATPQIGGWAACLWQAIPSATPYELRQIIIKCATLYNTPTAQQGYGIPDFSCARDIALHVKDSLRIDVSLNWVKVIANPFYSELDLVLSPHIDQQVDFWLIDMTGKIVYSTGAQFHKGINSPFSMSLSGIPSGVYLLKAVSATDQQLLKVVKY